MDILAPLSGWGCPAADFDSAQRGLLFDKSMIGKCLQPRRVGLIDGWFASRKVGPDRRRFAVAPKIENVQSRWLASPSPEASNV